MDDDQEQQLDVFDNAGNRGRIPAKNAETAFGQRGFKYAVQDEADGAWKTMQPVKVTDNLGRGGWMPAHQVQRAIRERGFTVGQPMQAAGDKVVNGKFTPGTPQPWGDKGIDPFLFEGASKVGDAAQATGHVLKVGGKTMLKMAADPTPTGIARSLAEEREEQEASPEGVPRSKDVVMQPLRELVGERQPGESATLGFTGHDPAQQPLSTRAATALSSVMGGDPASARMHFDRASTLLEGSNPDDAGRENQRGSADLMAVPLATVGTGRLLGSRNVQSGIRGMARDVVNSVPETLDRAAELGDLWPPRRIEPEPISNARNWLAKKTVAPLVRRPVGATLEDARFGRSPEQAITDEGLVGTRRQLVSKTSSRIGELSDAIDAQLENHTNAGAQIDAEPIIDAAVDRAIDAAKKTGNQAITTRLQNLRDALKSEYGPIKGTPAEINQLKRMVGEVGADLGAFKGTDPVEASAASAMGDVYSGLKNAVNEQVPEVAPLNDRIANLISARMALKRSVALGQGQSLLSGLSLTNLPFKIADATITSGPVRTGVARILNAGNTLDVPKIPRMASKAAPVNSPMTTDVPQIRTAPPLQTSGVPALPRAADLDPTSPGAARISELRNELIQTTDPAERARIQEGIDYELHRAGGIPWNRPDQATRENLPAPDPSSNVPRKPEPKTTAVSRVNPGDHGVVDPKELKTDPTRFQYKRNVDEAGVTNALKEAKTYDPNKGGVLLVWEDPANRKTYVVNGHHRYELAARTGYPAVAVRKIQAASAEEARAIGAEVNISEGHGTGVDAARYFKAAGIRDAQDAMNRDLPLGQAKVQDGLALGRLDDSILDKVESEQMTEARGVAIGAETTDPAQQEAILKLIEKQESKGRKVTDGTVRELARFVKNSGNKTVEQGGLFGANMEIHSLAMDKADISAYVKQQIAKERRMFGAVASKGKAEKLELVPGQSIRPEENARISQQAAMALEAYDKLSSVKGPVDDILEKAARDLASSYHKPEAVKSKAYELVRKELANHVGGQKPPSGEARQ